MATHRQRAVSPQAPRVYVDTPRASTGSMLTAAYDTRFDTRPRNSVSNAPSARDSLASRNNSVYETQPVSKRTYVDSANGGGTISRTQYTVRPRRDSDIGDSRRPSNVVTKNTSPTRDRPDMSDPPSHMVVYKTPREDSSTSRYLQPAQARGTSHHPRHGSTTKPEAGPHHRAPPPRTEKEYVRKGPYVERVADSRPSHVRSSDDDGFSYTGPREQFARDYPAKPPRRESVVRRERPVGAVDLKLDPPFRRDTAPLPPSSSRQLDRVERDERRSGFESDPDRSRTEHRPRHSTKGPVVHQRDDGYLSAQDYDPRRSSRLRPQEDDVTTVGRNRYRELPRESERERTREPEKERTREPEKERERVRRDYDREDDRPSDRDREKGTRRHDKQKDREYERERTRPKEYDPIEDDEPPRRSRRHESPDRSTAKTLATAAVGGLAAAGIAGRKSGKDDEASESEGKRERKHRRRKSRDSRDVRDPRDDEKREIEDPEARQRRKERKSTRDASSGSDTAQDTHRRRPQSRTRTRRDTNEGYGSEREKPQLALPAPETERRPSRADADAPALSEPSMDLVPLRGHAHSPTDDDERALSPGETVESRPRKVSIVEPIRKEELRPRGILKPQRMVPFPEDPNPTREGVAPLKQAGKDGIPEGARWTKVSRILVNPEALQKANERFEERDDYVIVLRVLSREEIEKLGERTTQIREQREHDYQKELDERRRRIHERGTRDSEHEGDYEDAPRGPSVLAIEAPPGGQPTDLRQLVGAGGSTAQVQQGQQGMGIGMGQGYPPVFPWSGGPATGTGRESIVAGAGAGGQGQGQGQGSPGSQMQQQQQQQNHHEFDASSYSQNV